MSKQNPNHIWEVSEAFPHKVNPFNDKWTVYFNTNRGEVQDVSICFDNNEIFRVDKNGQCYHYHSSDLNTDKDHENLTDYFNRVFEAELHQFTTNTQRLITELQELFVEDHMIISCNDMYDMILEWSGEYVYTKEYDTNDGSDESAFISFAMNSCLIDFALHRDFLAFLAQLPSNLREEIDGSVSDFVAGEMPFMADVIREEIYPLIAHDWWVKRISLLVTRMEEEYQKVFSALENDGTSGPYDTFELVEEFGEYINNNHLNVVV